MGKLLQADEIILRIIDLLHTSGGLEIHAATVDGRKGDLQTSYGPSGEARLPSVASASNLKLLELAFELSGSDVPLLLHDDGELLQAIHHVAGTALKVRGADPELLSFSVGQTTVGRLGAEPVKLDPRSARRRLELQSLAAAAVIQVRSTSKSHTFEPMTGAERRLLHEALRPSGLKSASSGEGFKRGVVLYPPGVTPPAEYPRRQLGRGNGNHSAA